MGLALGRAELWGCTQGPLSPLQEEAAGPAGLLGAFQLVMTARAAARCQSMGSSRSLRSWSPRLQGYCLHRIEAHESFLRGSKITAEIKVSSIQTLL